MIKTTYLNLRIRSQSLCLESLSSSYKIKKSNFKICMHTDFKLTSEDIFHLVSPMIVVNLQTKNQSSLLSSLQTDVHQGLLSLNLKPSLKIDKKIDQALNGAEALITMTEWREFNTPDFAEIKSRLKSPVLFDGRNLYDTKKIQAEGFDYYAIGKYIKN